MNTKPNINFIQTAANRKSLQNQNLIHILIKNLTKKEVLSALKKTRFFEQNS